LNLFGIEVAVDASIGFEIHHSLYLELHYIAIIDVLNEYQSGDQLNDRLFMQYQ